MRRQGQLLGPARKGKTVAVDVNDRPATFNEEYVSMTVRPSLFAFVTVQRNKRPGAVEHVRQLLRLPPFIIRVTATLIGMIRRGEEIQARGLIGIAKLFYDAAVVRGAAVGKIRVPVQVTPA